MEIEKPFACVSPSVISIILFIICFCPGNNYSQQQNASVSIEFELAQPLGVVRFQLDGTDAGYVLSGNETCDIGYVDSIGTPISGAPAGNPDVNGTAGIPVDSSGAPLGSFYDTGCVGAFYPLFAAAGGYNNEQHPNSAICIYLHLTGNPTWSLSNSAQLLSSTTNVTVDQLKWKMDATTANGYQGYTGFTTSSTVIASGNSNFRDYLYIDYGLLVENADAPGANVWLVTYTLVET
jgi:hypothetical protein